MLDALAIQGITTEIVGNCGFSTFPSSTTTASCSRNLDAFLNRRMRLDWSTAGQFFDEATGCAVNWLRWWDTAQCGWR